MARARVKIKIKVDYNKFRHMGCKNVIKTYLIYVLIYFAVS